MAKAASKTPSRLFEDLQQSFLEVHDYLAGKETGAIVHHVVPNESDARKARIVLGLTKSNRAA